MVEIIAHRANLEGPHSARENSLEAIYKCLRMNISVEIDLWAFSLPGYNVADRFFFGHDHGEYEISDRELEDLTRDYGEKLYFHCKSIETLNSVINNWSIFQNADFFMHDSDMAVLTKNSKIWTYPGEALFENSIAVLPESQSGLYNLDLIDQMKKNKIKGVCTDYPLRYRGEIK